MDGVSWCIRVAFWGIVASSGCGFVAVAPDDSGWQLLSGTTKLESTLVHGSEPRGWRAEVGAGLLAPLSLHFGAFVRGGLAFSGVLPEALPASTQATGFFAAGTQLSF